MYMSSYLAGESEDEIQFISDVKRIGGQIPLFGLDEFRHNPSSRGYHTSSNGTTRTWIFNLIS